MRLEEERRAREHAAFVATSFLPAANFHSLMRACVRACARLRGSEGDSSGPLVALSPARPLLALQRAECGSLRTKVASEPTAGFLTARGTWRKRTATVYRTCTRRISGAA